MSNRCHSHNNSLLLKWRNVARQKQVKIFKKMTNLRFNLSSCTQPTRFIQSYSMNYNAIVPNGKLNKKHGYLTRKWTFHTKILKQPPHPPKWKQKIFLITSTNMWVPNPISSIGEVSFCQIRDFWFLLTPKIN